MIFYSSQFTHRLSHKVSFHIIVRSLVKNIYRIVLDEGASNCIMYISCWKSLVSPNLNTSATLLKAFDRHMFQPHGIIITLPIELGGKNVFVDVKVVDAPLEYNLLLWHTWFYEMIAVVSSLI
jgi:hypothetical protein